MLVINYGFDTLTNSCLPTGNSAHRHVPGSGTIVAPRSLLLLVDVVLTVRSHLRRGSSMLPVCPLLGRLQVAGSPVDN